MLDSHDASVVMVTMCVSDMFTRVAKTTYVIIVLIINTQLIVSLGKTHTEKLDFLD
jgi:hypothetical protein